VIALLLQESDNPHGHILLRFKFDDKFVWGFITYLHIREVGHMQQFLEQYAHLLRA
jgi:hypothetical protein